MTARSRDSLVRQRGHCRVWSMEDLIVLTDARETGPKKRGPYTASPA